MSLFDYQGTGIPMVFATVKDYGANGDGTTDDASAIQSALDALKDSGGIIFFPTGPYLIKTAVVFYSNQSLIFENGAKILQGVAMNNLLHSYCASSVTAYTGTHDVLIYGAVFDGGTYEQNNTLVGIAHAKNVTFERCTFRNAYGEWHNLEINSSYNVKVIECDFEGSRKTSDHAELIQIDADTNNSVYPWGGSSHDDTVCKYVDISGCIFHDCTTAPAIGNHNAKAHQYIRVHDCVFDGISVSRGAIAFYGQITDLDVHDNTFVGCSKGIGTADASFYIHDNRFVDCTTAIAGTASVAHNNMINGTYVA